MTRTAFLTSFGAFLVFAGIAAPVAAQLRVSNLPDRTRDKEPDTAPVRQAPDLKTQRKEIAEQLIAAQRRLQLAKNEEGDAHSDEAAENLSRQVGNLKQVEVLLAQQQAAEERKTAAEKEKLELEDSLKLLRASGPPEETYSFLLLDQLRDELVAEVSRKDAVQATVNATTEALQRAKTALQEKEKLRRKAKEALDVNKEEDEKPAFTTALSQAELDARLAAEAVKLHEIEAATEKLAQETHELRITFLTEKSERVAKEASFTKDDLEQQLFELEKQERDLKQSLQAAETTAQFLDQQWFDARGRLDSSVERSPDLIEEVEARRLARLAQQQRITVLGQRLSRLEDRRQAWHRRFKIAEGKASKDDRNQWFEETKQQLDQLDRERRLQSIRMDEVRKDQTTLEAKIESDAKRPPEIARWLQGQQKTLGQLLQLHERNIVSIDASRRVRDKLLAELDATKPATTWRDRWEKAYDSVDGAWNYELASIDDRPITVKKIVTGVLLLFFGYLLSGLISRMFGGRILPQLGVHPSAASALQSVLFYTLVVVFALFALRLVNVPLTAFTLLGGALALGVGFGSQNIINNFISGLILLAERPIKVGDLVQINDLYGNVEHIGARSTRVKTGANHEIIVPNSSFLENDVINWTLSDDSVRTVVKVGVIYGSPTRDVTRLIMKAVQDHGKVFSKPEPIVLFTDFGDNSLNFEVHFWLRMRSIMERLRIESDIRYRIDQLFRDAGLVIAFPQRDVHLDSARPLEIRLLPDSDAEATTTKAPMPSPSQPPLSSQPPQSA